MDFHYWFTGCKINEARKDWEEAIMLKDKLLEALFETRKNNMRLVAENDRLHSIVLGLSCEDRKAK